MSKKLLQLVSVPMEGCTPKPNRLERLMLKFLFVTMGPEVSQGGTRLGGVVWGRESESEGQSDQGRAAGVGQSGKGWGGVGCQETGPGVGGSKRTDSSVNDVLFVCSEIPGQRADISLKRNSGFGREEGK